MDDRALLQHLIAGPATGDALASAAGQTRAAVWKRIEALREAGVAIEAKPGRGYALSQPLDLLDAEAIVAALCLPVLAWLGDAGLPRQWVASAAALLVVFTHRGNLARLRAGTESRFAGARLLHRWRRS